MSDQAYSKHIPDKCGNFLCSEATTDHTLRKDKGLWICPVCGVSYGAGGKERVREKIFSELNGHYSDRGQLEELEETTYRLRTFCATLGEALVDKGVLTEDEVVDMVHGG